MNSVLKIYTLLVFLFINVYASAQQDNTLFFMHELPQANFVNPAVPSTCKIFIGFPALSSVHANYSNTALTFKDAFSKRANGDLLYFNGDKIVSQISGKELITSDINLTLFTMGIHVNRYYLTFSVNEKVTTYNMIASDLLKLGWNGNTRYLGDEVSADGTRINGNSYHEFAFGASKDISAKWRLGVRAKVLFGLGNVYTPETRGSLFTDRNSFILSLLLKSKVNSSLPINVSVDEDGKVEDVTLRNDFTAKEYFLNFNNLGVGADVGFIYYKDEKTTFSGSLLDFGAIFWSKDVNSFVSEGMISYPGTTENGNFNNSDYLNQLTDSLRQIFTPVSSPGEFMSPLVPKIYFGVTHNISDHFNTGVLVRSEIYRNRLHPSFTLSANSFNYKILNASLSYTLQNGEYTNIGAGVGVKLGAVQIHIISDNIPGFFKLDNTRNANIRFGLSFVPGCDEKIVDEPVNTRGGGALPCYYSPYRKGKSRKAKRKVIKTFR